MDFDSPKNNVIFHVIVIILLLIVLYYVYTTAKYMRQFFAATAINNLGQARQPNLLGRI